MKMEQYQNSISATRVLSLYLKQLRKFKSSRKVDNLKSKWKQKYYH